MPNILETQPSLFANSSETAPLEPAPREVSGVDTDVTRVVRSSLVIRPVYELSARRLPGQDESPHPAWDHLNVIWLAFATLDVISELTEFAPGGDPQKKLFLGSLFWRATRPVPWLWKSNKMLWKRYCIKYLTI